MDLKLKAQIERLNPWLKDRKYPILPSDQYIPRIQTSRLVQADRDDLVIVLVGPRQAGKTTLGRYLCQAIIKEGRYSRLLYLNCDNPLIRHWLDGVHILDELTDEFGLSHSFILFLDEIL